MKKKKGISAIRIGLILCTLVACGESAETKSTLSSTSAQTTTVPSQSHKSVQGFTPMSGTVPGQTKRTGSGSNNKTQVPTKTTTTTRRSNTPQPVRPTQTVRPTQAPTRTNAPKTSAIVPINNSFLNECQKAFNQKRSAAGLGSVTADANLTKLAEARVKEIPRNFSHTRPDGRDAKSIFNDYGFPMPDWRAENIAKARKFTDAADIFSVWMNSRDHKANLLNPKAKRFGMAIYTAPDGLEYSVIILAS